MVTPLIPYDALFLFVSLLFAIIALTWIIVGVRAWLKRHSRKGVLPRPDRHSIVRRNAEFVGR
jgi:hypothetical protein